MKIINVGKENSTFQEIQALKNNRLKRSKKKQFFVEGVQNIKNAIDNNWQIDCFIISDYAKLSNWAKGTINSLNIKCYQFSPELMAKISDKEDVSEIVAIVNIKKQEFDLNGLKNNPLFVLLDRPAKKGNFGTIIRSCDAFDVDQLLYMGHGVDIYDPKVVTASMGSFFRVPFKFLESGQEFESYIKLLKEKFSSLQVVATSLQGSTNISRVDFNKPTLLLIGNETDGLSKFLNEHSDILAKIDMREGIDSLNVACATSIFLYEIDRQRNIIN